MALYEKLPATIENHLYEVEIDAHPALPNLRRFLSVIQFVKGGFSIRLEGIQYFANADGTKNELTKELSGSLYCDKTYPWVNPQTGERVEANEDGEYPAGSITRHAYIIMLSSMVLNISNDDMEMSFIVKACQSGEMNDSTYWK